MDRPQIAAMRGRTSGVLFLVDQGAISAGNFLTGVVLARALEMQVFGTFVLLNALILFIVGFQTALTLRPLVLEGAPLDKAAFRRLFRTYLLIQGISLSVVAGSVAAIAFLWQPARDYVVPLTVTVTLMQAQEICRRVLYTRSRTRAALLNNVVHYDLRVAALGAGALTVGLSLHDALWVIAGASLLAVLLGVWQLRDLVARIGEDLGQVARRGFKIGNWSAGSAVLTSLAYEVYPPLVQTFHGLASTAGLGVIRQLLGPVNLVLRPIESQYLPRAARALVHEGEAAWRRVLWRATMVSGPPYFCYLLALMAIPGPIIGLVFGERYTQYADLVRVFAAAEILGFPLAVLSVAAATRRLQRLLFLANAWNGVVLLGLGLSLVGQFGLLGVAISGAAATAGRLAIVAGGLSRVRGADSRALTGTPSTS